jgi:hypothetical protein
VAQDEAAGEQHVDECERDGERRARVIPAQPFVSLLERDLVLGPRQVVGGEVERAERRGDEVQQVFLPQPKPLHCERADVEVDELRDAEVQGVVDPQEVWEAQVVVRVVEDRPGDEHGDGGGQRGEQEVALAAAAPHRDERQRQQQRLPGPEQAHDRGEFERGFHP